MLFPWYLTSKTKRLSPHHRWHRMRSTWTHICPPKPREELFSARLHRGQVRLTCLPTSPADICMSWPIWRTLSAASTLPAVGNNWQLLSDIWTGMSSGARLPFTPQHISAWHPERCPLSKRRCECLRMALFQRIRKINVLQKTDGYTCFRIFGPVLKPV